MLRADTLRMPNGERLEGTVMTETSEFVVFKSSSFGEIRIARAPGLVLNRTSSSSPAAAAASAAASLPLTTPPSASPPAPGRSWVRKTLGLSDRWAYSLEANLLFLNSEYRLKNHAFESTLSYKIPDAETPQRTRHEFALFGSLSL